MHISNLTSITHTYLLSDPIVITKSIRSCAVLSLARKPKCLANWRVATARRTSLRWQWRHLERMNEWAKREKKEQERNVIQRGFLCFLISLLFINQSFINLCPRYVDISVPHTFCAPLIHHSSSNFLLLQSFFFVVSLFFFSSLFISRLCLLVTHHPHRRHATILAPP